MRWISSEGGPLVLLPKRVLTAWNGCSSQSNSPTHSAGVKSDYDRACEINGYTGIIAVQMEEVLVLGEPMQTTWISVDGKENGMIVQWLYADNEISAFHHAQTVPYNLFRSTGLIFHVPDPELYLFDSAIPGNSLMECDALHIELKPGDYHVETASYKPDERTFLVIHQLRKERKEKGERKGVGTEWHSVKP